MGTSLSLSRSVIVSHIESFYFYFLEYRVYIFFLEEKKKGDGPPFHRLGSIWVPFYFSLFSETNLMQKYINQFLGTRKSCDQEKKINNARNIR